MTRDGEMTIADTGRLFAEEAVGARRRSPKFRYSVSNSRITTTAGIRGTAFDPEKRGKRQTESPDELDEESRIRYSGLGRFGRALTTALINSKHNAVREEGKRR